MNLDWLIVGGGIHGVHIAARLIGEAGVSPEKLCIVDPAEKLLSQWQTRTALTGMTHLRSPSVHHLDIKPWSLQQFAGQRRRRKPGLFAHPYNRPALALFNTHCEQVVETFGLAKCHIQSRALSCSVHCDGVRVVLSDRGELETQNLVLAVGSGEQPRWPQWAPRGHDRVHHIFDPAFDHWPSSPETVAVIGGGISAGQVALRLLKEGHQVHMVSRHALRKHQFDSDPGWLGPKFMMRFQYEKNLARRRAMITEARHQGSVPPDIRRSLQCAIRKKRLAWYESDIHELEEDGDSLHLNLSTNVALTVDRVLLATGYLSHRPGGSLVDDLISSASLPCAQCGYPIVDTSLRWHPRIYVSGPLAELELGPSSRNIAGARRAADRLVDACHQRI